MTMIFGIGHDCVMHYLCVFCEYRRLRSRYTCSSRAGMMQGRAIAITARLARHVPAMIRRLTEALTCFAVPVMQMPGAATEKTLVFYSTLRRMWGTVDR
jgi:hypothetical protein